MNKRMVFENLQLFFNQNFLLLPKFLRFLPAVIFYLHNYKDIFFINRIKFKINNKNVEIGIPNDTEILFIDDDLTHRHLFPFYQSFEKSFLIKYPDNCQSGYRSKLMEYFLGLNLKNIKIVHFLTLELLTYTRKKLLEQFKFLPIKKMATVHLFMPISEVMFLSAYFDKLFVFSKYQKDFLNSLGISNIEYTEHPAVMGDIKVDDKYTNRKNSKIPQDKIVFSMLGSIRKDKGIHILAESIGYLEKETKERIFINIVGFCNDQLSKDSIEIIKKSDIPQNIQIFDSPISTELLVENLVLADYYLIPYSRQFRNCSAQLIEAAWRNIPVISSDFDPINGQVVENNLGYTFENNNPVSLAKLLTKIAFDDIEPLIPNSEFIKLINPEFVKMNHNKIYNEL